MARNIPKRFSQALLAAAVILASVHGAHAAACMDEAFGGATTCGANDVSIASISVTQVDESCTGGGDTFTFDGTLNVQSTASLRYDIGFYIGPNPQTSINDDCFVTVIPPGQSDVDGDSCGDTQGINLGVVVNNVTVPCTDSNGDGFFDVNACTAWSTAPAPVCTGPDDAVPGTASKCNCEVVETDLQVAHCTNDTSLCDDDNPCTDDICNTIESGLGDFFGCTHANNSLPCADSLFCNGTDTCSGGTCSIHAGDPCPGADGDGNCSETCDETTDTCTAADSNGSSCNDSLFCNGADTCSGGACSIHAGNPCPGADGDGNCAESCNESSDNCNAADPNGSNCNDGVECTTDDTCNGGFCAGTDNCGVCSGVSAGVVCRPSFGVCDVAETCDGTSPSCPANAFSSSTCRAANGVCDVAETCSSTSPSCPADAFAPTSITCRAANGVCDALERCTGSTATCPADVFSSSSTTCRAAAGVCDFAESCTGSSATCPPDGIVFAPTSTTCRLAGGVCDAAEQCTGSTATCPSDAFSPSSTTCRAAAGVCDVAESCTGSSPSCPVNAFSTATCRAASGVCDMAETCSSTSPSCPADGFVSTSTTCRAAGGICDAAERCTGSTSTCPADVFSSSSTTCRAAAGICDIAENCTGTSASCPGDAKSTAPCRAAAGSCDVSETCDGALAACPADAVMSSSTLCRASAGVCDVAEQCSGTAASCPSDVRLFSSTVCRPSAGVCDISETCSGSGTQCPGDSLAASSVTCRPAASDCDVAETCTAASASCPGDSFEPAGVLCGSANETDCDHADTCDGSGFCLPNLEADGTLCDDSDVCTLDQCIAGSCQSEILTGCPIVPDDQATGNEFGKSAALSADYLVVGAPASLNSSSGRVHLFLPVGDSYVEYLQTTPIVVPFQDPDPATGDLDFGASVDVDQDTIVVGAPFDVVQSGEAESHGSASVFFRSGDKWMFQQKLVDAVGLCSELGTDVAISGNTIVLGAPGGDCALVFERSGASWALRAELSSAAKGVRFGQSVDVSASSLLVGAPGGVATDAGCPSPGVVHAFRRTDDGWTLEDTIDEPVQSGGNACFGMAVGLDGATGLIGAPFDDASVLNAGAAYVVDRADAQWQITAQLLAFRTTISVNDRFGSSLDIHGDVAIVGAPGVAAYTFERSFEESSLVRAIAPKWDQVRPYVPPADQPPELSKFAFAVATTPGKTVVGAPNEESNGLENAGAVYPGDAAPLPDSVCGDNVRTGDEQCDDGSSSWKPGEGCNGLCRAVACGDPNDTGSVTASDALFTLRTAVGQVTCDKRVCDVNGDGKITAADALGILRKSVGIAATLACPQD